MRGGRTSAVRVAPLTLVLLLAPHETAVEVAPVQPAFAAVDSPAEAPALAEVLQAAAALDVDRAADALRRGLEATRSADASGALAAYAVAEKRHPGLADWARVLAAHAAAEAGDTAAVRERLASAAADLARESGWRARVLARRRAGDPDGALREGVAAAAERTSSAGRAAAWLVVSEVLLERGDSVGARSVLRRAIEEAPASSATADAAARLSALAGSPDEAVLAGTTLLNNGKLDDGVARLERVLAAGLPPREHAAVRLDLGRALFGARRWPDAARQLARVKEGQPTAPMAAEAALLAGRALYRQGSRVEGLRALERVAAEHSDQDAAAEALFILADLEQDEGRLTAARARYVRIVERHPTSGVAAEAAMRLGGMDFAAGRHGAAAEVFERWAATAAGREHERATFWAARARLAGGEPAAERLGWLADEGPASYYGLRALDLLGEPASVAVRIEPGPAEDALARREAAGALARLDVLRAVRLDRAVDLEMERVKLYLGTRPGGLYHLAEQMHQRGETLRAIRMGRDIHAREARWNARLLRIVYPFPYRDVIMAEAKRNGVDPYFVAALIRQESTFNPAAVSPVGAVGLMQLMPATARMLASRVGIERVDAAALASPALNVRLGTLYLAELLGRYDGDPVRLLAAYNAGPSRVARWRELPEAVDADLFVERIPYDETRDYVRIVQESARIYAALYGPTATLSPAAAAAP